METTYQGIDYGMGQANIDHKTGIRYGVISIHEVTQSWSDSADEHCVVYCPKCGNGPLKKGFDAKRCPSCHKSLDSNKGDFDETGPASYYYNQDGYLAEQSADDTDIFITKSPFYTLCAFCSPCAPGAGYITEPRENGVKAYCFGHDWFDDGKAPYPVYSVETDKIVEP